MRVNHNKGYAAYNRPAKGCRMCIKGEKLVLFITGLCGQRCFYCPISENKFGKDVVYANEWNINNKEELREEIRLTGAKGAGITGGDPLLTIDKTCQHIEFLKNNFGKNFHIHLYTPLQLVNKENLEKLYKSGLDEIRFHPDINNSEQWGRIILADKYSWDVGVEIPCIPGKEAEIIKLIEFIKGDIKFINLNELEFSDTTIKHYNLEGYKTRNEASYAAKDSEETAIKIINYAEEKNLPLTVYFCSAKLKDKAQMGNRIKRRAKESAKEYDKITKEGMLVRGVIYLEELKPGFDYRNKIEHVDRAEFLKKLEDAKKLVFEKTMIRTMDVDDYKLRLTLSAKDVKRNSRKIKKLGLIPAIVEEYPTHDAVEVEIHIL
ncbi:MAG: radical SAM protein [Nanoarchaeota archaeon]|nr:radical SAM protein [Nanoarchaeota archaeon]MBU1269588.1 radical SAM protein [Nanoarchaeota archaeon]MBU1604868.1 radical SAM protein [Nanoarchaeota archaeon]